MLRSLIIDDEQNARDIMTYLLTRYCPNVDIVGVADGLKSARTMIKQAKPDIVFLDIHMKDGSGFDLLDGLNASKFHVVFVTAYAEHDLKAFKYRAFDYLVKPVDKDELIQTVDRIELIKRLNSGLLPLRQRILDNR